MPSKTHLPGLDALRFFAALCVMLSHIELIKAYFSLPNQFNTPVFFELGGIGVSFFFVLSGFLITHLLFKEKEKNGQVSIVKFYWRRVYRIWPLYYLLVFLGFFVFPYFSMVRLDYFADQMEIYFVPQLILNVIILPNIGYALFQPIPHIGHLWSIGIEEQFYLIWPWIIRKVKNYGYFFILGIVLLIFLKLISLGLFYEGFLSEKVKKIIAMSKFENMMIGALGAYLLKVNHALLRLVYQPVVLFVSLALIPILIFYTPQSIQDGIYLLYALIFAVIILNVSTNRASFLKIDHVFVNKLGTYSYGIYMYHFFIVAIVVKTTLFFINPFESGWLYNIIVYVFSVVITIVMSWISHEYFESYFIRTKDKHYST